MIPTEEIIFISTPMYQDWPKVALFIEGTDLVVATTVTNKQARTIMSVAQIQAWLTHTFGAFTWTEERDNSMRCTDLRGTRSVLREGELL